MAAHRQSALLLHGLGQADQRWILSQLGEEDRRILAGHLAELKELGIPADPAIARQAGGARAVADQGPLHKASAATMLQVLADEPLWLVRQVLALADWPWRQAYLEAHPEQQRERLGGEVHPPLHPQAAQRLLARLAERAARHGAAPATAALAPGPLARLRQAMRRSA
ncbi:hypothetical protein HF313_22245 [Massilia atriviolacea]|uniref:Uncharacterized protein n=1 Tax=Massilia atriviolacea TaxID=2495579 RepID=A0A430HFI0_9BURK|nr:hypothetical protein [Massilia atriviolacea]RSZ56288.1 hypothetical protein EJB06_25680 [Massilia atriviolacea]